MRRVLLFVVAAGLVAAVLGLSAAGQSPRKAASRFVAPFALRPWHNQAAPRGLRLTAPVVSVPGAAGRPGANGGACEIASGRCSLSPCVDAIAFAPGLPLNGLLLSPVRRARAPATCRHPKSRLSRTSSA
jgi:hypothetical protein